MQLFPRLFTRAAVFCASVNGTKHGNVDKSVTCLQSEQPIRVLSHVASVLCLALGGQASSQSVAELCMRVVFQWAFDGFANPVAESRIRFVYAALCVWLLPAKGHGARTNKPLWMLCNACSTVFGTEMPWGLAFSAPLFASVT